MERRWVSPGLPLRPLVRSEGATFFTPDPATRFSPAVTQEAVRARAVAPALEAAVWVCLSMSVMLMLEVF
jgi:hypothetical protein